MVLIERKFIEDMIRRIKVVNYVKKELEKAGVIDINIQRTTLATRIGITAENPGLIIGRKGRKIQELSEGAARDLNVENPQIEVLDVEAPDLEPRIIARWIVRQLERGIKPKRAVQRALERVISAGALGVEIVVKGKIIGKGAQARTERAFAGYLKKAGNMTKEVKVARERAVLKQGVVGVQVKIVPPKTVFADKIDLSVLEKREEKAEGESVEEGEKGEKRGEELKKAEDKKVDEAEKSEEA